MISYNGDIKNRHECNEIKEILETKNYRVYVDYTEKHGKSLDKMAKAVDNSIIVIVCLNNSYIESDYCKLEARYAISQRKKILPVILEKDLTNADKWLSLFKEEKNYVDYTKHDYESFSKVILNEVNIKLNMISNDGWNDFNADAWFKERRVNSSLLSKIQPYDAELLHILNTLDHQVLEHIFTYLKKDSDNYANLDVKHFKKCLNELLLLRNLNLN